MAHAVEHAVERAVGAADGFERCHGYHVRTQHVKAVEIVVHGLQCGLVLDDGMRDIGFGIPQPVVGGRRFGCPDSGAGSGCGRVQCDARIRAAQHNPVADVDAFVGQ
ncbi:hypothetical protein G6F68_020738 [Rhizopus microsporus]|nr:hypothetical protein G6F68_020738 [Rhizopus microsporus]